MRIALIGNGNLAWHLSHAIRNAGSRIDLHLVTERNPSSPWLSTTDMNDLVNGRFHMVLLAVPDNQIALISAQLPEEVFAVHFSGATSLTSLKQTNRAVCWPCQTLTQGTTIDYKKIPILFESSTPEMQTYLEAVLKPVWGTWMLATTEQRQMAHLAAVFSNNFSNYMQSISQNLLKRAGLSENLLLPMLKAHIELLESNSASSIQTGPAKRKDENTMQLHQFLLQHHPEIQDLYTLISRQIQDTYNNSNEL
ncbi:MAG: hypothetical protein RIR06_1466 [Bacteroidota bacterium]